MDRESLSKWFTLALVISLGYLSFLLLQGFIISILLGAIIAYMVYPVYKWLVFRTKSRRSSALILSTFVIGAFVIFFILLAPQIITELGKSYRIYERVLPNFFNEISNCSASSTDMKCAIFSYLTENVDSRTLKESVVSIMKPASDFMINNIVSFVENLPNLFLQLTIVLFSTFYFLNNGAEIVRQTLNSMPLKPAHKSRITERIDSVLKAVIYGNLLTAFFEGMIAAVIFYALGINMALVAGVLVMFFALVPPLGAMIIWAPIVIILFILKEYARAVLLGAACLIIFGYIDNIARPTIISRGIKLSSFWVLLGVLGGLSTFGFVGLIIGPLILALFVTILKLSIEELKNDLDHNANGK